MIITQEKDLYVARHTIVGLDDDGKECNLENFECTGSDLDSLTERVKEYMTMNNIDEEIIIK